MSRESIVGASADGNCAGGDVAGGYCRPGHKAPLCAVCTRGHYLQGGACVACRARAVGAAGALALVALVAGGARVLRGARVRPLWEFVWAHSLSTQAKIAWSAAQILAQFPTLLRASMPAPPRGAEALSLVNLDPLTWLGLVLVRSRLVLREAALLDARASASPRSSAPRTPRARRSAARPGPAARRSVTCTRACCSRTSCSRR